MTIQLGIKNYELRQKSHSYHRVKRPSLETFYQFIYNLRSWTPEAGERIMAGNKFPACLLDRPYGTLSQSSRDD